jgi:V/A-type H+-transporting ATPase subunit D
MAFSFQYNKASLFQIQKQLDIRIKALPVLKNKEMALRLEVKKSKLKLETLLLEFKIALSKEDDITLLCSELDTSLITVDYVESQIISVAGVKVPDLGKVVFNIKTFNLFIHPYWFAAGIKYLEEIITMKFRIEFLNRKLAILEKARRKTTQKVNLYEKNQIPAFNLAILKIKRFLEDEENLSKSAQKILKSKTENKPIS